MEARWSYVIVLLATAVAFDTALGCAPAPRGYTLKANSDWFIGLFSSDYVTRTSPSSVSQQCSSNANCLAYNSGGQMLMGRPGAPVRYLSGFNGYCTYAKDPNFKPAAPACAPAKRGYTLKADTNWNKAPGTTESQTNPAAAEQQCNSDANCIAWNSFGYIIRGRPDSLSYTKYDGLCVYVKDAPKAAPACAPAKKGYTLKADTNWAKVPGTTESQTSPAAAEQQCNSDPDCIAWNSFGYIISGERDSMSYSQYKGLCVYVKDPPSSACPSKPGYQTLADTNWSGNSNTKESQTSPENAARICRLDANCVAWNSYGYYILGKASDIKYNPYKGLCVYVKKGQPITVGH